VVSSHWIDLLIVALYMGGIAVFGLRFARRQTSTERYFVAQRSIPGWAMGISLFAAISSSLSFIGYPGSAYAGNWNDLVQGLMVIPALVVAVWIAVPFYRRVVGMSAYEYFGKRFGYGARVYSSLAFSLAHFSKLAFVFYLVTLTVHIMIGTNMYLTTILLGVVTITYTCVGGLEAVIWTDVIHACTAFVGVLICLGFLLFLPPGGPTAAFRLAWDNHRFSLGSFDFDLSQKGVWTMALYGLFWYLQKYTTDQTVVQRYLAAKSDSQAVKGTVLGMSICLAVWTFFMLIGSLLWSYFQLTKEALPARIIKADYVFPYFLSAHLPPGCMGLFIAALTASAMSMVSSDLNCLSSIGVEDFYRQLRPSATEGERLRVAKIVVAICGVLTTLIALVLARYTEHALSLYFTVTAILSGGLFGLFFLAFFSRRANPRGVWTGIIACVLFTTYAVLTSGLASGFTWGGHRVLDLGWFNFPWQGVMIGVVGHLVLVVVGYAASLCFPSGAEVAAELTAWGWLERRRARHTE